MSDSKLIEQTNEFLKNIECDDMVKNMIKNIISQYNNKVATDGRMLRNLILSKQQLPDELLYKQCIEYYPGDTSLKNDDKDGKYNNLQLFIMYRPGEAIPEKMYYDNCGESSDQETTTPLTLWIIHRKGEPIPHQLYIKKCRTRRIRQNRILKWIIARQDETLPKLLTYPGWLSKTIYDINKGDCFNPSIVDKQELSEETIEKIKQSFMQKYITPIIPKYIEEVLITQNSVEGKDICDLCGEFIKGKYVYTDNHQYCCTVHYSEDYENMYDVYDNKLNINYTALEQLIDYAE